MPLPGLAYENSPFSDPPGYLSLWLSRMKMTSKVTMEAIVLKMTEPLTTWPLDD